MQKPFFDYCMRYLLLFLTLVLQLNVSGYNLHNPQESHVQKTLTSENTNSSERSDILFRYQGQYEDVETGLYYNRFRYYDCETGTYLSQDPISIAGGLNIYAYVHDPNSWIDSLGLSPNLNTNTATGNFGIYEISINGDLHKIGKADLGRVTQSSGLPTRLHQQIRQLEKIHGKGNVTGVVVQDLGTTTTKAAKGVETARLQAHYDKTGKVPDGNKKSFKPKTGCG